MFISVLGENNSRKKNTATFPYEEMPYHIVLLLRQAPKGQQNPWAANEASDDTHPPVNAAASNRFDMPAPGRRLPLVGIF